MSRFPAVTETFILRELIELERQGERVELAPLLRQGERVELAPLLRDRVSTLHPEAASWDERALYTPFLDRPILLANLRVFLAAPGR